MRHFPTIILFICTIFFVWAQGAEGSGKTFYEKHSAGIQSECDEAFDQVGQSPLTSDISRFELPSDRKGVRSWLFPLAPTLKGRKDYVVEDHSVRFDREKSETENGTIYVDTISVAQAEGRLPTKLEREGNQVSLGFEIPNPPPPLSDPEPPRPPPQQHYVLDAFTGDFVPYSGGEVPWLMPANDPRRKYAMIEQLLEELSYANQNFEEPEVPFRQDRDAAAPLKPRELHHNYSASGYLQDRMKESALPFLDQFHKEATTFALKHEERRGWNEEFLKKLGKFAPLFWDATLTTVRLPDPQGGPGKIAASMRVISSKPDPRLLPYPHLLLDFLQTHKGYVTYEVVPDELTSPLLVELAMGKKLPRPVLNLPDGLLLPTGERIYKVVGVALEPGAVAADKSLNAESTRLVTAALFRNVFSRYQSPFFNRNLTVMYAFGDKLGTKLWNENIGWEILDREHPTMLNTSIEHGVVPWWVLRCTPESLEKWIDGLLKRKDFSQEEADKLRAFYRSYLNPLQ